MTTQQTPLEIIQEELEREGVLSDYIALQDRLAIDLEKLIDAAQPGTIAGNISAYECWLLIWGQDIGPSSAEEVVKRMFIRLKRADDIRSFGEA